MSSKNAAEPTLVSLAVLSRELGVPRSSIRRSLAAHGVEAVKLIEAENARIYFERRDVTRWKKAVRVE